MWQTAPEQFIQSVVYLGHRAETGERRYTASGFLVSVDRRDGTNLEIELPTYLITARHVIARLRFERKTLFCAIQSAGSPGLELDLPYDGWQEHPTQDIAIFPFDFAQLTKPAAVADWPWRRIVASISIWQFGCAPISRPFRFSHPVHMVGLWRATSEVAWPPIVRSGFFAATSPTEFQLETGRARLSMVDGTVTKGMSGGIAFITSGEGIKENALLGLIYGFWPLPESELAATGQRDPIDRLGAARDQNEREDVDAFERLRSRIDVLNSQLALIVRDVEISNFLSVVRGEDLNAFFWDPPAP